MAVTKLNNLIAKIDCPYCFSLISWDDPSDVKISNGNKYIICPECGQTIQFKRGQDYWFEENNSNNSNKEITNGALIIDAIFDTVVIPTDDDDDTPAL